MPRLIDANALIVEMHNVILEDGEDRRTFYEVIERQPTIEQPEIIHCRDCKHYYYADNRIPQEQRYVCDIGGEVWQPDDYCSYGERREVSE